MTIPETWGKMPHGNKAFFRKTMKDQFPELGFCEDDWKCEHLATHMYPGWHRTYCKGTVDSKRQSARKTSRSAKSLTPAPNVSGHSYPPPAPSPVSDAPEGPTGLIATIPPTSVPTQRSDLSELQLSPLGTTLASTTPLTSPILEIEPRPDPSPAQEIGRIPKPSHLPLDLAPGPVHSRFPSPESLLSTSSPNLQPCSAAGLPPVTPTPTSTDTSVPEEQPDVSLRATATPGALPMPTQLEGAPNHPIQVRCALRVLP